MMAKMTDMEENKNNNIQHNCVAREKCCAKCRYFEDRTFFCRYNPPIPVPIQGKNGQTTVTSVYSKINIPALDWCQKFENKTI